MRGLSPFSKNEILNTYLQFKSIYISSIIVSHPFEKDERTIIIQFT